MQRYGLILKIQSADNCRLAVQLVSRRSCKIGIFFYRHTLLVKKKLQTQSSFEAGWNYSVLLDISWGVRGTVSLLLGKIAAPWKSPLSVSLHFGPSMKKTFQLQSCSCTVIRRLYPDMFLKSMCMPYTVWHTGIHV